MKFFHFYFVDKKKSIIFVVEKGKTMGYIRTKIASKGHYYLCIRTVDMMGTNITDYIRGVVYKSEWEGKITNEHGDKNHGWSDFEGDKIDAINLSNCFVDLGTDIKEIRKHHVVYSH